MTWRVLISAPYLVPAIEEFRARLEAAGVEIILIPVRERLSEAELLPVVKTVDGVICGDDQFTKCAEPSAYQAVISLATIKSTFPRRRGPRW